ncbi:MAG: hypothetical protein M1831_000376 [Alyxoria varia]|nr:MAG: hypothetical protein M1831_000376 [Alyxoria varia]
MNRQSANPAAARQSTFRQSLMPTFGRIKQMKGAKEMEKVVHDMAERIGEEPPPYDFLELTGKGTYGRVFKSRSQSDGSLVALKIINVDDSDYETDPQFKDEAIQDFVKEISVLRALRDSNARNINHIHEAFTFYSQLWIVSDYCPGGSVHTLMKAAKQPGLDEKYIVAVSRELAIALKYVHEVGIIHRDVKAGNILIHQDGGLQLCDFGIAAVIETNVGKRSTFVGTPYWMAPEIFDEKQRPQGYGAEIDIWGFGSTVYELATGLPPNSRINPEMLSMFVKKAPKLEGENYSAELCDFVSFCLVEKPSERPSAKDILQHDYVRDTSESHPTSMLKELIEQYTRWEQSGGERISLFNNQGAKAPERIDHAAIEDEEWNFSTADDYDADILAKDEEMSPWFNEHQNDKSPGTPTSRPLKEMTPFERAQMERRALRAEVQMGRLFNPDADGQGYEYGPYEEEEPSDLPLRNSSAGSSEVRESVIDLDAAFETEQSPGIDLGNVPTIKANNRRPHFAFPDDEPEDEEPLYEPSRDNDKRSTMGWKFPSLNNNNRRTLDWSFATAAQEMDPPSPAQEDTLLAPTGANLNGPFRPALKHTVTAPAIQKLHQPHDSVEIDMDDANRTSMIDLDSADEYSRNRDSSTIDLNDAEYANTSFATSFGESAYHRQTTSFGSTVGSAMSESSSGNPFDLGEELNEMSQGNRGSTHEHSYSEPKPPSSASAGDQDEDEGARFPNDMLDHEMEPRITRAPSVKASMDSLRYPSDEEDDYSPEATTRQPLYRSFDTKPPPHQQAPMATSQSIDTATMKRTSDPANKLLSAAAADSTMKPVGRRSRQVPRGRDSRARKGERLVPEIPPMQPFPKPVGLSMAALDDDAAPEVMSEEMTRLLDECMGAFQKAGMVISRG